MKMTFLDRAIAAVSPAMGARRLKSRMALDQMMNYEAASRSRRTKGWRTNSGDANSALRGNLPRMRDVSRDMIRNTPYAARAQNVIVNNVIGKGILPSAIDSNGAPHIEAENLLRDHFDTTAIDSDGLQDLYGVQERMMNAVFSDGEVIVRRRLRRASDRLPLTFQVQVIEADYLDTSVHGQLSNGNTAIEGVEFDLIGRRVAYHIHRDHPGSVTAFRSVDSDRISAQNIIHLFRGDRPGQVRGVPWLAPVALRLQDLQTYEDAQLVRQQMAQMWAMFIQDQDPDADGSLTANPRDSVSPGMIEFLPPGKTIQFADPPKVDGYDAFTSGVLRGAAAGLGITYEAMSGDLSKVNFSSARMGRLEMDRNVSRWQELMMIRQGLAKIGEWFRQAAALEISPSEYRIEWTPPRRALVDPNREVPPMLELIEGRLKSRRQTIRELGFDPDRVEQEIQEEGESEPFVRREETDDAD